MGASKTSKAGRRPGNQDTRGKILDAARDAFATKGFAGTSMRAIAADASVDAALIHHYFDSKQQLFLATVQIPVPIGDIAQHVGEDGIDGLGERLIRTILRHLGLRPAAVAGRGGPHQPDRSDHVPLDRRVPHPRGDRPDPGHPGSS